MVHQLVVHFLHVPRLKSDNIITALEHFIGTSKRPTFKTAQTKFYDHLQMTTERHNTKITAFYLKNPKTTTFALCLNKIYPEQ